MQQTHIAILSERVDQRATEIKAAAAAAGAETKSSTFERQPNNIEMASLVFQLPMKAYADFVEKIKGLGKVKNFTVQRNDAVAGLSADASAPAQITLRIYSQGDLVGDEHGLWATIRRTFAQGFGAVMWSLRMIGVSLAFLAPWVIAGGVVIWFVRRRRR